MANLISIGQIIDKSWDHYVAHFKQLMTISLFALIIPVLMIVRLFLSPSGEMQTLAASLEGQYDVLSIIGIIYGVLVAIIAIPVITIWINIMLIKAVGAQDKKITFSVKQLRADGWKNFLHYLLVAFLKTIFTILPILAIVPGLILIFINIYSDGGAIIGGIGIVLSFIGLIVAAILVVMLGVQLGYAGFEMLLSQKKGMKAIKGSRALIQGRFWATLWRMLISRLIFSLVSGLLMAIAVAISFAITYVIYEIIQNTTYLVISNSVELLLSSCIAILTTPIFIIADYYIYDSLNKTR
jgi:hypothetical protein